MYKDCFAFRETINEKDGYKWKTSKCDCLTVLLCRRHECRFYKPADSLTKYEFKIYQTTITAYKPSEA